MTKERYALSHPRHVAWRIAAICLAGMLLPSPARGEDRPLWAVITTPALRPALEPLVKHREGEGFEAVVSTLPPAAALAALPRRPACILLVGDEEAGQEQAPWRVASRMCEAYRWHNRQEQLYASDALWGDLDGDFVPDVPVGRIPGRTVEQVRTVVDKILAHENRTLTPEQLHLPVWAGAPGYGAAIDSLATGMLVSIARTTAPRWMSLWLQSADTNHPLCGWPPDHAPQFTEQIERSAVLTCMVGHAWRESFHSMRFGGTAVGYTAAYASRVLPGPVPSGPLVILACYAGDFAARSDCLAEVLLQRPGGPVAVIAATAESHPLTNLYTGRCVLPALDGGPVRIGELWARAQRAAHALRDPLAEGLLRAVESNAGEAADLPSLKRDHLLLYALLGDPATRVLLPGRLHVTLRRDGAGWRWSVEKPAGARTLYVEFRPPAGAFRTCTDAMQQERAGERFRTANASLGFTRLQELPPDADWSGEIATPGTLRLIAVGEGTIWAAGLELRGER